MQLKQTTEPRKKVEEQKPKAVSNTVTFILKEQVTGRMKKNVPAEISLYYKYMTL